MKFTEEEFKSNYRGLIPETSSDLRQLTQDEAATFTLILFNKGRMPHDKLVARLKSHPITAIIISRLGAAGIPSDRLDPTIILFAGCVCSTPGRSVMWAFTIARIAQELGRIPNFEDVFVSGYFADGLPSEEMVRVAWDNQKCPPSQTTHSDNFLDRPELWPRI
jgi:hypothetical protein